MGIFKRSRGIYEVTIRRKGFNIRKTFASLDDAKAFEVSEIRAINVGLKGQVSMYRHVAPLEPFAEGVRIETTETVRGLLTKYLTDVTPLKKGAQRESSRIWRLFLDPISDLPLSSIDSSDIAKYIERRRLAGLADATVRLEVMLLSSVFRTARKRWGIKIENPASSDDIQLPAPSRERVRRLMPGEYRALLSGLRSICRNPRIIEAVKFAVRTGMRQGEILSLHSSMIDEENRVISLPDSKTGRRDIPISSSALAVLKRCPGDMPFSCSADRLSRAFKSACNAARIVDLHFHDLRHEAISRFFEKGLDITEVALISGHRTLRVLMRYTHHRAARVALKLR